MIMSEREIKYRAEALNQGWIVTDYNWSGGLGYNTYKEAQDSLARHNLQFNAYGYSRCPKCGMWITGLFEEPLCALCDPGIGKPLFNQIIMAKRIGNFYDVTGPDAEQVAKALCLERYLAKRKGQSNFGIPYHAVYRYQKELAELGINLVILEGD